MKLALLVVLLSLGSCASEAFTAETLTIGPDAGDVPDAGAGGANMGVDAYTPPEASDSQEAAAARDVLADPWPDDVVVVPVPDATGEKTCMFGGTPATGCPCVNCFIFDNPDGTANHIACCDGSGYPPDSATDHLCNQGDFPTPHKGYCAACGCQ